MTMTYLGRTVAQCDPANLELGLADCCVPSGTLPTGKCVSGGYPQYNKWGFSNDTTPKDTALTFAQIQSQVSANKPWAYVWKWTTGGGHVMVGSGWEIVELQPGTADMVLINNPEPWSDSGDGGSRYWIPYDYYVAGANHTHGVDYYNITRVSQ
jgi:hypothetical protein